MEAPRPGTAAGPDKAVAPTCGIFEERCCGARVVPTKDARGIAQPRKDGAQPGRTSASLAKPGHDVFVDIAIFECRKTAQREK